MRWWIVQWLAHTTYFKNNVIFLFLYYSPDPQCQERHTSHFFHDSTFIWKWQLAPLEVSDLVIITFHQWNRIFNFWCIFPIFQYPQSFHHYFYHYVVDSGFHRQKWGQADVGTGWFVLWWLCAQSYTWQLKLTPKEKEPSSVQKSNAFNESFSLSSAWISLWVSPQKQ